MTGGVGIWGPDERLIQCNDAYRAVNRNIPAIVAPGTTLEAAARGAMRAQYELLDLPVPVDEVERLAKTIVEQHRRGEGALEFPVGPNAWTRLTAGAPSRAAAYRCSPTSASCASARASCAGSATSPRPHATRRRQPTRPSRPSSPP